ncbi:MAG: cysteine synthase A [Polyangiaceae bacterium]
MNVREGFAGTVGSTPLIRMASLSEATGSTILGKAEFLNPGGSVKDRAALAIVLDAEKRGVLRPKGTIVEGTAGNTGIGLAHVAKARGYRCLIVMPKTMAQEKIDLLRSLGAEVELTEAVPFADPGNYYHVAKRRAEEVGGFWADQFENEVNARAHYETTGPELLEDTGGGLTGFVCASGTGGTIGGVSKYLKSKNANIRTYLIDCDGSSLFAHVEKGTLDWEGSSVLEGIGIRRVTKNFAEASLDGAFRGSDREAIAMARYLMDHEGLYLGGSAALNCVGAVKLARLLGKGQTIATVLCDGGARYASRLWNEVWLKEKNLLPERSYARSDLGFVS